MLQDSRILPSVQFGVNLGESHIIRNAGGRTPDAFRSLVISQQMLGTEEIIVVQHTDCGMLTFTDEQARKRIQTSLQLPDGSQGTRELDSLQFLPFSDLEENVRRDVQFLKDSQLVKSDKVSGFVVRSSPARLYAHMHVLVCVLTPLGVLSGVQLDVSTQRLKRIV